MLHSTRTPGPFGPGAVLGTQTQLVVGSGCTRICCLVMLPFTSPGVLLCLLVPAYYLSWEMQQVFCPWYILINHLGGGALTNQVKMIAPEKRKSGQDTASVDEERKGDGGHHL